MSLICVMEGRIINGVETPEGFYIAEFDNYKSAINFQCNINNTPIKLGHWQRAHIVEPYKLVKLDQSNFVLYDDFFRLDDRAIQKIMREFSSHNLAIVLKGMDGDQQESIFRNMSDRAAQMLKEDMEYMGPVRLEHIKEIREELVSVMQRLYDNQEIEINKPGVEMVV